MKQRKLVGYKTHDAHVFLERLMPVGFRGFLPTDLWKAVAELCTFFRDVCASSLDVERMRSWKGNIAITICKLEMYFPPSFFDSMEHLPIHVAEEVLLGGPVHYRWMYPFERFIGRLKGLATNKSSIEATIVNAYLHQEIAALGVDFLPPDFPTNYKRPRRNETFEDSSRNTNFSIYNHAGAAGSRIGMRQLTSQEFWKATHYLLTNTPEVDHYYDTFKEELVAQNESLTSTDIHNLCVTAFPAWFKSRVSSNMYDDLHVPWIRDLSDGFDWRVTSYDTYKINNYKFHTKRHGVARKTVNYQVHVVGEDGLQYYGEIEDIITVRWKANHECTCVLFGCVWYDPAHVKEFPTHGITELDTSRLYASYDPFILAQQAQQVYFTYFPGMIRKTQQGIVAVCKVKPTNAIDMVAAHIPYQFEYDENVETPTVTEIESVGILADNEYCELSRDDGHITFEDEQPADTEDYTECETDISE